MKGDTFLACVILASTRERPVRTSLTWLAGRAVRALRYDPPDPKPVAARSGAQTLLR